MIICTCAQNQFTVQMLMKPVYRTDVQTNYTRVEC